MERNLSVTPQRIKKYPAHVELTNCSICSGPACYHFYGALACDSCRTFFRRFLIKNRYSKCINGDDSCDVNPDTRKDCPKCRFRRCLAAGMRPQLVTTQSESKSLQARETRSYRRQPSIIISPTIKPLITYLDTQIDGLTRKEKAKVYEMLNVTFSTLLLPDETADLVKESDCRTAVLKTTFRAIAKVIKALTSLKSKDYIGTHNQEILMKGSASEFIFLRSIPFFDYDSRAWHFKQNPFDKESEVETKMPMAMLKCLSNDLFEEYETWVDNIHPAARRDFVFFAIVSAIDFYNPNHPNLENPQLIKHEQDIFYKILQKYLITKLGPQTFEERFANMSLAAKIDERLLDRAHVIRNLYENTVLPPSLCPNGDILSQVKCGGER